MHKGIFYALLAAVLFGASTPFAKLLAGSTGPVALAALLYLGSGVGLLACFIVRACLRGDAAPAASLTRRDLPWLAGAIATGGVAGPVLLLTGLAVTPAAHASLLLNMEGVFTVLLSWYIFRENIGRRIAFGMTLIVGAGVVLSLPRAMQSLPWGALAIVGACLCWAIDNNLTRNIAASDALQIACIKGLAAGAVDLMLAAVLGQHLPQNWTLPGIALVGFGGYGLSLVMFVLALRHLGTARTGAYFSAAPFAGALIALALPGEQPGLLFWVALVLMIAGLYLHLTETHAHEHVHAPLVHAHPHSHDAHHQHVHDVQWDGVEPHVHVHQHEVLRHTHAHYPDIHHRHEH